MNIIVNRESGRVKGYWQFIVLGFLLYTLHFTLHPSRIYAATSTAEFLRINPSAFSSAQAGADVAYSGKIDLIYSNPSGLASIKSPQLFTGYTAYIQSVKLAGLAFAKPVGKNIFGVSVVYLGLNSLDALDNSGQPVGTAAVNNFGFSLFWARNVGNNLAVGAAVKQVHQMYDDVASDGICADAGSIYRFSTLPLSFGISLQNFGPEINGQKPPSTVRAGALYTFSKNPLSVSAEIEKPVYSNLKFKTGAEYEVAPKIYFRGGYEYLKETGILSGVSAGLGFKTIWQESYIEEEDKVKKIGVNMDYAFTYFGELGDIHKVSIGFEF